MDIYWLDKYLRKIFLGKQDENNLVILLTWIISSSESKNSILIITEKETLK